MAGTEWATPILSSSIGATLAGTKVLFDSTSPISTMPLADLTLLSTFINKDCEVVADETIVCTCTATSIADGEFPDFLISIGKNEAGKFSSLTLKGDAYMKYDESLTGKKCKSLFESPTAARTATQWTAGINIYK